MSIGCELCPYKDVLDRSRPAIDKMRTGILEMRDSQDAMNSVVANVIVSNPNPNLTEEEVRELRGDAMDRQAAVSRFMSNFTEIFEATVEVLDADHCDVTDHVTAKDACPKKLAVLTAVQMAESFQDPRQS